MDSCAPFYLLFRLDVYLPLNDEKSRKKMSIDDPKTQFTVVINHEEQYSIWPSYKEIPGGWRQAGKTGSKEDCLAYIGEEWTDMRPKSLREAMLVN